MTAPDGRALTRRVVITPSMCGNMSLVFGQLGDWTWEAVRSTCGTNVHAARDSTGRPAYLAFYYFHVRGGFRLHPLALSFGDEVDVTSRVFDFGSHSVFTLHRIAMAEDSGAGLFEPEEVFDHPRSDCLYVETLNRWVGRGPSATNSGLVESVPPDFRHEHLPKLPERFSPRRSCGLARDTGTFFTVEPAGYHRVGPAITVEHPVDVVRDINGAGLTYFAAYAAICDGALLRLWRELGRDDRQFLRRQVLDHRLAYFGNVDVGATFATDVRLWRRGREPFDEIAELSLREQHTGRLLAVAAIETRLGAR